MYLGGKRRYLNFGESRNTASLILLRQLKVEVFLILSWLIISIPFYKCFLRQHKHPLVFSCYIHSFDT